MQPHEQRVVDEKRELDEKHSRLGEFIVGPVYLTLDEVDRSLLISQLKLMSLYSIVLGKRIARFVPQQPTEVQMLETQIVTLRAKLARPKVRGLRNVPLREVENV